MIDLDSKWFWIRCEIKELLENRLIDDESMDYIVSEIENIARKHLKRKSKAKTNKEEN